MYPYRSLALLLVFAVCMSGCGGATGGKNPAALTAKIGKPCTIQFRRNLLGAATNLPIPPTAGSINNADCSVSGTLSQVTDDWIAVKIPTHEYWVPRDNILLLIFSPD